jgi:hypothetical protein
MKIHTDTLTMRQVYAATSASGMRGVTLERCDQRGSRSRARSFDVTLRGNSTRKPNPGTGRNRPDEGEYAATWDEWGMFIAALYLLDPEAIIGQYGSRAVFEEATAWRFDDLDATTACPGHHWVFGGPMIRRCSKCQATNNYGALYAKGSAATSFA